MMSRSHDAPATTLPHATLMQYLLALISSELSARATDLQTLQNGQLTLTVEVKSGTLNFLEVVVVEKKNKHALDELLINALARSNPS